MDDSLTRREAARPRREAELGAKASPQDGELMEVHPARDAYPGLDRLGGRMERRNSLTQQLIHQRHMPVDPLKFHIPKKTKEKRALFQYVSTESREYEDMMNAMTSSYIDTGSSASFAYSKPRLVHSELLEKEFVEKRKEMKADGRTDKELEESYCFLLADSVKVPLLCEKGLLVGQSRVTVLGDPSKGVYLSRYSDLLQINPLPPGFLGEVIIFKVMKGKVKSMYENMKNLQDPTPRFDSHISKNASKVTAVGSYRAFELTQHYFYEYSFDELRERPRQVCPYAVLSFLFKGKDSSLPSKPLTPVRLNSQSADGTKERAQFTVWTGDLVKGEQLLYQISLRSFSPPFLPHRLPEKLEMGCLMRLDRVTRLLPSVFFSYDLYSSSQEVVKSGHCCSLLEVTDRFRSTTSVKRLLQELEKNEVVLVTPLADKGFLFLLSSVQMATPPERGESWRRCLQALFIFPDTADVARTTLRLASTSHDASVPSKSSSPLMPKLNQFIPALHHSLVKARANPPADLSAGVERQARDYLTGLKDGKVRQYPMGAYEALLDEGGTAAPKHHRVNMDGYLRSYLYSPALYLLSVARARQIVEAHCGPEEPHEVRMRKSSGGQREAAGGETTSHSDEEKKNRKMQQLVDLVITCKRNAENEVKREEAAPLRTPGRKRKLEQETAERAIKLLKASQEPGRHGKFPAEGNPAPPGPLASVVGSLGLRDLDLSDDGSELSSRLLNLLTGLNQAARGTASQGLGEVPELGQGGPYPFDRLATKLGLPTNCDIDLRRQDDLEEQTAGSISSLEGFSPSSHSGETNHSKGRTRGNEEVEEEWEIPWILIPITGLRSERYTQRERNIPQDPRFQHLTTATSVTTTTSTTLSPGPSPTLAPSPPSSPLYCQSPDRGPTPSPEPSPPPSPSKHLSPHLNPLSDPARWESPESTELSLLNKSQGGVNEERLAPTASRESTGVFRVREEKTADPSFSFSIHPSITPSPKRRKSFSSAPPEGEKEAEGLMEVVMEGEAELLKEKQEAQAEREKPSEEAEADVEARDEAGKRGASPPPLPLRGVDNIVDKNLGNFSSDIQLLLLEESIHYSSPQSPHSTSNTETSAPPHAHISQFSQYVTFYNPRPPVQDYISSLQDSMSSMLADFEESWPSGEPVTSQASLESTVSAFVSSIRASNVKTRGGDDALTDADSAGEVWRPLPITKRLSDKRNSPTFHVTLSDSTSAGSAQQHSPTLDVSRTFTNVSRTFTNDIRETPHRTVNCNSGAEGANNVANFSSVSKSSAESSHASQPVCSPTSESEPEPGSGLAPPPPTALSSLISQLQPEVFNSLVEIIKDVKRNSLQFYLHTGETGDAVYEGIKELLLKQGNVQQLSPEAFLTQENSDNRLLVIIKNKEISGSVHKIPSLVALKRRPSVVFMGIDTPDDVMNNSFNELFVSGGCIVSDEMLLNPDHITPDRLDALLRFLEQHSSPENLWRWKIHFKTHKKLREQARFRRDAASLLELLSTYQKRQIVEFLPYHHCDMNAQQSPDLPCLLELQARYTLNRHTVFLTEHLERHFEKFAAYSDVGIVVASVDDILHDFPKLVGLHDSKDKQPVTDAIQDPKEVVHPASSIERPHHLLHPSGSGPPPPPPPSHLSDQLVPDASGKEGAPLQSAPDFKVLHQAISQLRAERQAQLQQRQHVQLQCLDSKRLHPSPPLNNSLSGPTESVQVAPGKTAVAATLDLIHSALQPEEEEEGRRRGGGGGGGVHRDGASARAMGGNPGPTEAPTLSSNQNTAALQGVTNQRDSTSNGREIGDAENPVGVNRSRNPRSEPEPPIRRQGAESCTAGSEVPGSLNAVTVLDPDPAGPGEPQQSASLSREQGDGLLGLPQHLPRLPGQVTTRGPMMAPLRSLGGLPRILGPTQVWTGGLVWGFQQGGAGPGLLGGYHNPAPQGGNWSRGGQRGGGFNRM